MRRQTPNPKPSCLGFTFYGNTSYFWTDCLSRVRSVVFAPPELVAAVTAAPQNPVRRNLKDARRRADADAAFA